VCELLGGLRGSRADVRQRRIMRQHPIDYLAAAVPRLVGLASAR